MYDEFENHIHQAIYVSATPGDLELLHTDGDFAEQIIRPTGLLDPVMSNCLNKTSTTTQETLLISI